jgi:hypothetical protein
MKYKLLLIGLLSIFGLNTSAKQIDEKIAKQVGQNFLKTRTNSQTLKNANDFELVYKSTSNSVNSLASLQTITYFYVFNASLSGFVIVSGDDNVLPILGYSDQGLFDPNNLPQNVLKWFEGYKSEIRSIIEQNIQPTNQIVDEWQSLISGDNLNSSTKAKASVNPLMQTKWNQSPYYNALCPSNSVTGCVATAMAQIMKYWNYPATGSGFHSYNHNTYGTLSANFGSTSYQWGSMPNSVNSTNNAVATLMYQVGVSVDMDYSPQSSGAYVISASSPVTHCSEYALKTYFGYKNSLQGIQRVDYNQTQWLNLIKKELDASRPILYAGFGNGGGHCFVADGYDNSDYIHFNWGWGGSYDGYFQINALNPSGTGTGGGSGGYNSGHQAVIGIEPPTGSQTFDMALYDYITPSSSTIYYGQSFKISTNIANNGANAFTGDYAAAIFDNSYNFVDYIQILTGYSLQAGYAYSSDLDFSTTGLFSMLPGTYYVGIFYRPTGGNWKQVANNGSYSNLVQMKVINPNDIELNSSMVLTPGITLTQGQPASVNLNIVNEGNNTFIGQYLVGLYNLDGSFAQTIGTIDENNGLQKGYTYKSPYLTFSTSSITVNPGTYLLAAQHNPNNSGWQLTGSSNFLNPIRITVIAPSLQPDQYETNNSIGESYNLPITFSGNNAIKNTTGSNCHITSDNDFYKIILPLGFNYKITPRIHDLYNSGNGNTYTLDGLFSYSTDGITWSDAYDDVMTGNIALNGGGTIYFRVAPYFAGETGTYLLSISLTRTSNLDVNHINLSDNVRLFPNPAKDVIMIDFKDFNGKVSEINMLDVRGQNLYTLNEVDQRNILPISLSNHANGVYFLQILTNKGILSKKIIISK